MAGLNLIAKGVKFDSYSVNAPAFTNALFWHYPRISAVEAVRNFIDGKADGTIIGSPTFTDSYMIADGDAGNYLVTSADETDNFTLMVTAANDDTLATSLDSPGLIGTFNSVSGCSIYIKNNANPASNPTEIAGQCYSGTDQNNTRSLEIAAAGAVPPNTDWRVYALTCTASASEMTLYDLTTGGSDTTPALFQTTRDKNTNKILVGTVYTGFRGKCRIAHAAAWNRALTVAELQAAKTYVAADLASTDTPIILS